MKSIQILLFLAVIALARSTCVMSYTGDCIIDGVQSTTETCDEGKIDYEKTQVVDPNVKISTPADIAYFDINNNGDMMVGISTGRYAALWKRAPNGWEFFKDISNEVRVAFGLGGNQHNFKWVDCPKPGNVCYIASTKGVLSLTFTGDSFVIKRMLDENGSGDLHGSSTLLKNMRASLDGNTIVTLGEDRLIKVWNRTDDNKWNNTILQSPPGTTSIFDSFGSDAQGLIVNKYGTLVACKDGIKIKIWTKPGNDWIISNQEINDDIYAMDVCSTGPSSDIIGYATTTGDIRVYTVVRGTTVTVQLVSQTSYMYKGYTERTYIKSIKFNHDCTMLSIATDSYKVAVFKLIGNALTQYDLFESNSLSSHSYYVSMARFHPTDSNIVYSSSGDKTLKEWTLDDDTQVTSSLTFKYPSISESTVKLSIFDRKLDSVLLYKEDLTVSIFNLNSKTVTHNVSVQTNSFSTRPVLSVSGDGNVLFLGEQYGTIQVWKNNTNSSLYEFDRYLSDEYNGNAHTGDIVNVITNNDGSKLMSATDNKVKIWNRGSDDKWSAVTLVDTLDQYNTKYGLTSANNIFAVCDDTIDNIVSFDVSYGYMKLWKKSNGIWGDERIPSSGNAHDSIFQIAISRDGTMIATFGSDPGIYSIKVWKNSNGWTVSNSFQVDQLSRNGLSISKDNNYILYTDDANFNVKLYRISDNSYSTVKGVSDTNSHSSVIRSAMFDYTADGIKIISCSDDGTIKIWTPDGNGYSVDILSDSKSPGMAIKTVVYGNQEDTVISYGDDKLVKVWKKSSGTWNITTLVYDTSRNIYLQSAGSADYDLKNILIVHGCVFKVQTLVPSSPPRWTTQDLLFNKDTSYCSRGEAYSISGDGNIVAGMYSINTNMFIETWKKNQYTGIYELLSPDKQIPVQYDVYIILSENGEYALTMNPDRNALVLWKTSFDGSDWEIWIEVPFYFYVISAFDMDPSGGKIAVGDMDGSIRIYTRSANKGELLPHELLLGEDLEGRECSTKAHTGPIYSVKFSSTGKVLFSMDLNGNQKTWKISTKQEMSSTRINILGNGNLHGYATDSLQKIGLIAGVDAYIYKPRYTYDCDQYCGNITDSPHDPGNNYLYVIYMPFIIIHYTTTTTTTTLF